jgi:hypothetical protein
MSRDATPLLKLIRDFCPQHQAKLPANHTPSTKRQRQALSNLSQLEAYYSTTNMTRAQQTISIGLLVTSVRFSSS